MAEHGFAESILKERPSSINRSETFDPLKTSIINESEPTQKSGYQIHRQTGGQELSLVLEMANGDMLAPEYTYLVRKELLKSKGMILLYFTDGIIALKGRNLKEIFLQLCRHSVASIREIPHEEDKSLEEESIVHEIIVSPEL